MTWCNSEERLDFRPLLSADFFEYAISGRNLQTKAVADAPTVPNFLSVTPSTRVDTFKENNPHRLKGGG
ncbi:hypothetical protein [Paenibacillus sp. P32E]|uniref:hypothetical protein n=1 Tax=Paenibacillus sp. P32E TaxID=1349434 RepID=UPI0015B999F5|nr:hypothetical protein [Paenibacillus sp. P32E]